MELRHLRYFAVAAEAQSFRRAAERLNIVQPALSRQIALLEQELGFALFRREKQRVKLEPAGRAYLVDVLAILRDIALAGERARRIAEGELQIVRIGFNEMAGRSRIVAESFRNVRSLYPAMELRLVQMSSAAQTEALKRGEIDAGFVYLTTGVPQGYEAAGVATDHYFFAIQRQHPFAAREAVALSELSELPFVALERAYNPAYYDQLMKAFWARGFVPRIVQETQSAPMMMNLIAAGMGAGLLVSSSSESWNPEVVLRPVLDLDLAMPLALLWHGQQASRIGPLVSVLKEVLSRGAAASSRRTVHASD